VAADMDDAGEAASQEWPTSLDVGLLRSRGWQPTPFRQFVIKMHSRCNLACDYCYMYTMADQSWRSLPAKMSPGIVSVVADRIAEHACRHDLDVARVIFHGGEPLLAGLPSLVDAMRKIRAAVDARVKVEGSIQTNGTRLDEEALQAFDALNIRVGVSLDGGLAAHDQSRRYANGQGSYRHAAQALRSLMAYPSIYAGLLCVINLQFDPIDTYEAMLEFAPPTVDFLLPHGNWSSRPPGRPESPLAVPYATWLTAVFERWYKAPSRETSVRLFEEIMHLLLGGHSASEAVGLTPTSLVVVETDGSIEQADALKSAYDGAARTGLHVASDSFDAVLRLPQIAARQIGVHALSSQCQACSISRVCGGGLYPHRYRKGSGFRHPSVYCPDLFMLITSIRRRLVEDLGMVPSARSECRCGIDVDV
jgi:uncharacterized protein